MIGGIPPVPGWRNQNALRAYPFSAYVDCVDTTGRQLPVGTFVDAALYPMSDQRPWLQSVSFAERTLIVAAGDLRYEGAWASGDTEVWLTEDGAPYRSAGVLVFGPEAAALDGDFVFSQGHSEFEAAVSIPLVQPGVRGFLLPDGSVVTGDVVFAGDDGVRVRTYVDDSGNACIRLDVVGAEPVVDSEDGCHTCGVVRCIRVTNTDGSHVLVSSGTIVDGRSNKVVLTMPDVDMGTLCETGPQTLPSEQEEAAAWCAEVEPTACPDLEHAAASSVLACPENGHIVITAPSSLTTRNPLRITAEQLPNPAPSVDITTATDNVDQVSAKVGRVTGQAANTIGVVTIGIRTNGRPS